MLETIREFGLEQLAAGGETEATMRRLAGWCLDLLEGVEPAFFTATQRQWVERLEAEHDNLRAVLAWALERGDAATARVWSRSLAWFWIPRGYLSEGRNWGERALALGDASPTPERASSAREDGRDRLAAGRLPAGARTGRGGAWLCPARSDTSSARATLLVLGWMAEDEGRFDEAEAHLTEALRHFQAHGIATWVGYALNCLGVVAYERGDIARAAVRFEEALDIFRATGNTYGIGFVLTNLAKAAREQGDYSARRRALRRESRPPLRARGQAEHRRLPARSGQRRGGDAAVRAGRSPLGGGGGPARGDRRAAAAPRTPAPEQAIAATRRGLGEEAFAAAWAAGRALTLAEAVAEALQAAPDAGQGASVDARRRGGAVRVDAAGDGGPAPAAARADEPRDRRARSTSASAPRRPTSRTSSPSRVSAPAPKPSALAVERGLV